MSEQQQGKYQAPPPVDNVGVIQTLKYLRVRDAIMVGPVQDTYFTAKAYKMQLLTNGLIKCVARARTLEPTYTPITNVIEMRYEAYPEKTK